MWDHLRSPQSWGKKWDYHRPQQGEKQYGTIINLNKEGKKSGATIELNKAGGKNLRDEMWGLFCTMISSQHTPFDDDGPVPFVCSFSDFFSLSSFGWNSETSPTTWNSFSSSSFSLQENEGNSSYDYSHLNKERNQNGKKKIPPVQRLIKKSKASITS